MFPREKTCGDGLTPRSVRQLADMGIEGALAGAHRYPGLRAHAFGRVLTSPGPEHPTSPSYGYVITRHDLDALVNERAAKAGATVWQGTEAVEPILDGTSTGGAGSPALPGAGVGARGRHGRQADRRGPRGPGPLRRGGRRGQLAVRPGPRHQPGPGPADGDGPARLLHVARPRPAVHRVATSTSGTARARCVPGYGWIFPLGDGRVNVGVGLLSTDQRWKGVNTAHPDGALRGWAPKEWELSPGHLPRPAHRRQAADGPVRRPPDRRDHPGGGRRRRHHQPVQRRGHRLRLRDRPPGGRLAGRGAVGGRVRAPSLRYEDAPRRTPTASTTGWPGPSSGSSPDPSS